MAIASAECAGLLSQPERKTIMRAKRLTLSERRDIFRALVVTQDAGTMSVPESRESVIKQFKITESQLRAIEEEGLEREWPPLDEAAVVA
jgi:hypothetical protein